MMLDPSHLHATECSQACTQRPADLSNQEQEECEAIELNFALKCVMLLNGQRYSSGKVSTDAMLAWSNCWSKQIHQASKACQRLSVESSSCFK